MDHHLRWPALVVPELVASVVAWRTEDVLATIASGMVVLWAVRFGF